MSIAPVIPSFSDDYYSIFEIYPQSEMPLLTQIARLNWFLDEPAHLLPDTLICRTLHHEDMIVFRIVDYRTNHSTCFSVDVVWEKIGLLKVFLFFPKRRGWLLINYWLDI